MEFINEVQIANDEIEVKSSLEKMGELAKTVIESGLNVSANEILKIATGKLSLSMLFQAEARERTKGSPKYVVDDAVSMAVNQANKFAVQEREARKNTRVLYRLNLDNFKMNEFCTFSYDGNLKADLTALNTRKLNEKQIEVVNGVEALKKAIETFNTLLEGAGYSHQKINISIPLTLAGKPDLEKISRIDFDHIESKKEANIQAAIKQKEVRKQQKARLERLYKDHPNKKEEVLRFLSLDPDGTQYDDNFHKNLCQPDKGSFKTKRSLA